MSKAVAAMSNSSERKPLIVNSIAQGQKNTPLDPLLSVVPTSHFHKN